MKPVYTLFFILAFGTSALAQKTYTMTPEQLISQLRDANPQYSTHYVATLPYAHNQKYQGNNIAKVECSDKHGRDTLIDNSPVLEMQIRDSNNKKHFFYFQTAVINDSEIVGIKSFYLNMKSRVRINDIMSVKLQYHF